MEIRWTDTDPNTGQRRFVAAERFAGRWEFRSKFQRRGEWTRGLEPTLEMWEMVLDGLERRCQRSEGAGEEDVRQVAAILAEIRRRQAEADRLGREGA